MAASFPGAIKSFSAVVNGVTKLVAALFNSPYDEITAIETELGTDPAGSVSDVKTRLAVALNNDGTIKTDAVITTMIKTAMGEVSVAAGAEGRSTLPGGEYGFYPQIKAATSGGVSRCNIVSAFSAAWTSTSYITNIDMYNGSYTIYAQQRYVTASGTDHWIYLLLDKNTKDIISAYSSPDAPCYGNGGNFDNLPHPFGYYDGTTQEIVILDKETCLALKAESEATGNSILTLVNEGYKPNISKEETYQPLHSGKFLGKEPKLVQTIPAYIKVRKLEKLTQEEKDQREVKQQQAQQKAEQDKQKKAQDKISAENKLKALGLTQSEIEEIRN